VIPRKSKKITHGMLRMVDSVALFDGYDQFFELPYERESPRTRFKLSKVSPARMLVLLLAIAGFS
jgi:hypothetical protein